MASRLTTTILFLLLVSTLVAPSARAAFIDFGDCLDRGTIQSKNPTLLQFLPLNVSASFKPNGSNFDVNLQVYGNITGQEYPGPYPPVDSPGWSDPSNPVGKIVDQEFGAKLYTTLFTYFNVLTYTPYGAAPVRFCNSTTSACPLGPSFYANSTDLSRLSSYAVSHQLESSFAFTTIAVTTKIQSGQPSGRFYGCVTAYLTPSLGNALGGLLRYLPLGILVTVGIATIAAAMLSPWSSLDIFQWSSNCGRDEDVLRLVTPGFADCLQYIQFVILTGSLALNYPGYYQPVVSRLAWSTLLFNQSLVSDGKGNSPIQDGLYRYRPNSIGLDRMTQLVGMTSPKDAWSGMMVWLVVIILAVLIATQVGFFFRWTYHQLRDVRPEDLRSKNLYFSIGNIVRISLSFFLLPIVALSMYQFAIASSGPLYAVVLAAVVLLIIIAFSVWLIQRFSKVRPRSFFFDDLQTLLAYGPLYNTYRDDTATFALVPIGIAFLRGIAIGAVQTSGVAQIIVLAIAEFVLIFTLNAFRPYAGATSMNVYHTCFSCIRLLSLMLLVAFIPALNASRGSRGWIGYALLLIHACVLVFGFFLNAVQTLIEVIARLAGAGAHGGRDAARGGLTKVFGMRQLSRRMPRRTQDSRNSLSSNTQILAMQENKELEMARTRSRSISASSTMLLEGNKRKRMSRLSDMSETFDKPTPDRMSTFSRLSQGPKPRHQPQTGGIINVGHREPADPYYRPPRRNTMDINNATGQQPRLSQNKKAYATATEVAVDDSGEGSSSASKLNVDEHMPDLAKTPTDYATREVDFYYGVRGPALSSGTRKLKTGPADPTGAVSSARGWFKGLMGGKTKDKAKGFEVVRSAKAPRSATDTFEHEMMQQNSLGQPTTYDNNHNLSDNRESERSPPSVSPIASRSGTRTNTMRTIDGAPPSPMSHASVNPPFLPAIDPIGGIELPSRIGSETSRKRPWQSHQAALEVPEIPRKSSHRQSSPRRVDGNTLTSPPALVTRLSNTSVQRVPFSQVPLHPDARHSHALSETSDYMFDPDRDTGVPASDRPNSIGYVKSNRTSDNMHHSDEASTPLSAEIAGPSSTADFTLGVPGDVKSMPSSASQQRAQRVVHDIDLDGERVSGQRLSRFRD